MTATLTEVLGLLAKATAGEWKAGLCGLVSIPGKQYGVVAGDLGVAMTGDVEDTKHAPAAIVDAIAIVAAINFLRANGERLAAMEGDSARLDWLERHVVQVRVPLTHGSRELWYAQGIAEEGEEYKNDIRERIDTAIDRARIGGRGEGIGGYGGRPVNRPDPEIDA